MGGTDEVVAEGVGEFRFVGVCAGDIEPRDKDTGETNPETTVGSKCESTESISTCEFPHTSHELSQSTIRKGYNQSSFKDTIQIHRIGQDKGQGKVPKPMTMLGVETPRA